LWIYFYKYKIELRLLPVLAIFAHSEHWGTLLFIAAHSHLMADPTLVPALQVETSSTLFGCEALTCNATWDATRDVAVAQD
jgi:hypothetical protein